VIVYPTETIYGLGCDPFNEQAVNKLLKIKQRNIDKGLILIASKFTQLKPLLGKLSETEIERLTTIHDRPITWVTNKSNQTPSWVSGDHQSIAVRLTTHPVVKALCDALQQPVVSTSANLSGQTNICSASEAQLQFGGLIDVIIDGGDLYRRKASEIRLLASGEVIRA
jgi:L-threonylcarbamoyladenylate synthase